MGAGFYGKRWISFDIPRMMDSYKYTSQYQILFDSCWLTKARRLLAFDKIIAHQQIFSAVFVIISNCGIFLFVPQWVDPRFFHLFATRDLRSLNRGLILFPWNLFVLWPGNYLFCYYNDVMRGARNGHRSYCDRGLWYNLFNPNNLSLGLYYSQKQKPKRWGAKQSSILFLE